jgi:FkbM family methyltransferase
MNVISKAKNMGLFGIFKAVLLKFQSAIKSPINRMIKLNNLDKNDYKAKFIHEGGIEISLPKISVIDALFKRNKNLTRVFDYFSRPKAEVLLRKTIFRLFKEGYISSNKSIIDIGCWLGDNSLVWAKLLDKESTVYAVDPSIENLSFGQELAELNSIFNVSWEHAVCSDNPGIPLSFQGNIDHAIFSESNTTNQNIMVSTTLDEIVGEINHETIGLLHVDVEGFELKVLRGAETIIDKSRPVITFEQHISKEDVGTVVSFLKEKNYDVFMINEVIPECNLDCRNFIAFDSQKVYPKIYKPDQMNGRNEGIFYACIGADLIAV